MLIIPYMVIGGEPEISNRYREIMIYEVLVPGYHVGATLCVKLLLSLVSEISCTVNCTRSILAESGTVTYLIQITELF